jgi:hypothetical protein
VFDDILPSYAHVVQWHTYPGAPFSASREWFELTVLILLEGDQLSFTSPHEVRREYFINAELTIEKFAGYSVYQYPEIQIKGVGRQVECTLTLFLEK